MAKRAARTNNGNGANLGFEEKLWAAADKLRGHMDAAEYKHVVLGLVFLKYISDSFQELHDALASDKDSDPEDRDEYLAENVFWVPKIARISKAYHAWRGEKDAGKYEDIAGFCKSASREEIESHGHVLTPGRYVGAKETEDDDDMPFDDRMEQLTAKLKGQFAESATLEKAILRNLASLGFTDTSSTGTKMPRTNWGDIARFKIAIPTKDIAEAATAQITSFVNRIHDNIFESRDLTRMRDKLLPHLLAGTIALKD